MTLPPNLERQAAVDGLVTALRDTAAIGGLAQGLRATIAYTQCRANPADPAHWEALDALNVWRALARLVDAIATERLDRS